MAVSPFPNGSALLENPSILVSQDGLTWIVPPGGVNPIEIPQPGVLADANVVYDDVSDQLWVYYLDDATFDGQNKEFLLRTTSSDGIHWSHPQALLSGPLTFVNSPSVIKFGSTFLLWTDATVVGECSATTAEIDVRTSTNGINWSAPTALHISQPGYVIWHLNVIAVPSKGQFMGLFASYPLGSNCGNTRLFFANSRDGLNWQTYPDILLNTKPHSWDDGEIYRSSLLYDPETSLLRVWYSADGQEPFQWHVGYTQELFPIK
jgi:hypothetical protein